MSEIQARWFAELVSDNISLPGKAVMNRVIEKDIVSFTFLIDGLQIHFENPSPSFIQFPFSPQLNE